MNDELEKLNEEEAEIDKVLGKLDKPKEKEVPETVEKPFVEVAEKVGDYKDLILSVNSGDITKLRSKLTQYLRQKKEAHTFKIVISDDVVEMMDNFAKCRDILKYLIFNLNTDDEKDVREKLVRISKEIDDSKFDDLISDLQKFKRSIYGKNQILLQMGSKLSSEDKSKIKEFMIFVFSLFPTETRSVPYDYTIGLSEEI